MIIVLNGRSFLLGVFVGYMLHKYNQPRGLRAPIPPSPRSD